MNPMLFCTVCWPQAEKGTPSFIYMEFCGSVQILADRYLLSSAELVLILSVGGKAT